MSLSRLATKSVTLKRTPTAVGAIIGDPVEISTNLKAVPPMPNVTAVTMSDNFGIPYEMWETFIAGDADIKEADFATIDGVEYEVAQVGDWPWPHGGETAYKHVILKERKDA